MKRYSQHTCSRGIAAGTTPGRHQVPIPLPGGTGGGRSHESRVLKVFWNAPIWPFHKNRFLL